MLVANPGHTPYSFNNTKHNCSSKSNTSIITPKNNALASSSSSTTIDSNNSLLTPCSSLLRSIAVRLNRGTDLIKQSVQKAVLRKLPNSFPLNLKHLTVPPTIIHRAPSRNCNSTDSLDLEMCHFKPIRIVPRTPNKRFTNNHIKIPVPLKAQPEISGEHRNLFNVKLCYGVDNLQSELGSFSAFYSLKLLKRKSTSLSKKTTERLMKINKLSQESQKILGLKRKYPVIKLKRCSVTKSSVNGKKFKNEKVESTNLKISVKEYSWNGTFDKNEQKLNHMKKISQNKNEFNYIETKSDIRVSEKVLEEQKECEKRFELEKSDFKFAKKLQSQINADEKLRTNKRITRFQSGNQEKNISKINQIKKNNFKVNNVNSVKGKKCNKNNISVPKCGKLKTKNSSKESKINQTNSIYLRRSERNCNKN